MEARGRGVRALVTMAGAALGRVLVGASALYGDTTATASCPRVGILKGTSNAARGTQRVLKNVDVRFISLCGSGKNGRSVIAKGTAEDGRTQIGTVVPILKSDAKRQMVYGVVYAPGGAGDADGHVMDVAEIEKAALGFMKAGRVGQIDVNHDESVGGAYVAESWLVKGSAAGVTCDALFPEEPVGTWCVGIKVEDAATWAKVEKGELAGLSLAGTALVEDAPEVNEAEDEAVEKAAVPGRGSAYRIDVPPTERFDGRAPVRGWVVRIRRSSVNKAEADGAAEGATLADVLAAHADVLAEGLDADASARLAEALGVVTELAGALVLDVEEAEVREAPEAVAKGAGAVETDAEAPEAKEPTATDGGAALDAMRAHVDALAAEIAALRKARPARAGTDTGAAPDEGAAEGFKGLRFVG